jgi:hypothetical protein
MYLVAGKGEQEPLRDASSIHSPSARWEDFPFSCLSHHGETCCDIAREWVIANDFAQLNGGDLLSGPRWLRARYEWGPSVWPLHWCDAVSRKSIDCGAHAALAHEAFIARGVTAYRAQFVQRYSADATGEWRRKWADEQVSDHWITENFIYHEGNAVLAAPGEVKLWDGSAGWWLNPRQTGGYGSVQAVRIFTDTIDTTPLRWGSRKIVPNRWHALDDADQPADGDAMHGSPTKAFVKK